MLAAGAAPAWRVHLALALVAIPVALLCAGASSTETRAGLAAAAAAAAAGGVGGLGCTCHLAYEPVCAGGKAYSNPCLAACAGYDSWVAGACRSPPARQPALSGHTAPLPPHLVALGVACPPAAAVACPDPDPCEALPPCAAVPGAQCMRVTCLGAPLPPCASTVWLDAGGTVRLDAACGAPGQQQQQQQPTPQQAQGPQPQQDLSQQTPQVPQQGPMCGCSAEWEPVCGADGGTYGNACEAWCAKVRVAAHGVCPQQGPSAARPGPSGSPDGGEQGVRPAGALPPAPGAPADGAATAVGPAPAGVGEGGAPGGGAAGGAAAGGAAGSGAGPAPASAPWAAPQPAADEAPEPRGGGRRPRRQQGGQRRGGRQRQQQQQQ